MYNTPLPKRTELPTSLQLVSSTLIAALVAILLLVTTVLPAEYGLDPTGVGRYLGLTTMGEIKVSLAQEKSLESAQEDTAAIATETVVIESPALAAISIVDSTESKDALPKVLDKPVTTASSVSIESDQKVVTLKPGEATEIKLSMKTGATVTYEWLVAGGDVNFDTHGDSPTLDYYGYGKGLKAKGDSGVLEAAFDGNHGWYWRNRSVGTVTITLNTQGDYQSIKRVM